MTARLDSAQSNYVIRPNFQHKFRSTVVKQCLKEILMEFLGDKDYDSKEADAWTKALTAAIREKLKTLELERYKFLIQVVIGEQKGEGFKMNCRCLWDSDTDSYAQEVFMNASMFCVAVVFGLFYY